MILEEVIILEEVDRGALHPDRRTSTTLMLRVTITLIMTGAEASSKGDHTTLTDDEHVGIKSGGDVVLSRL